MRTVKQFWTVVEQEMYKITGLFFWYQAERAGPLDKGAKGLKVFDGYL